MTSRAIILKNRKNLRMQGAKPDKEEKDVSSLPSSSPQPVRRPNNNTSFDDSDSTDKASVSSGRPSDNPRFILGKSDTESIGRESRISQHDDVEPNQRSILKGSQGYRVRPTQGLEKRLSFDTRSIEDGPPEKYGDRLRNTIAAMRKSTEALEEQKPAPLPTPYATRSKFHKSFYWLALNHRRLGLSHIAMFLLLACYSLVGAWAFYASEHYAEIETVNAKVVEMRDFFSVLADELSMRYNGSNQFNASDISLYLEDVYIRSLQQEGIYQWTTFYKNEDHDSHMKWTFGGALFFTFNVFTTTGYGSITCATMRGQLLTMIYGTLFIPVTLVIVRDIGQLLLVYLTKLYAICLIGFRRARGLSEGMDDEIIRLPIFWSILTLTTFLGITTIALHEFDDVEGATPNSGLSWWLSLYFAWVSTTTVGFGDIMPVNVTYNPLVTLMFFFGLPIMKVVNRITYIAVENGIFGTMTVFENRVDTWLHGKMPADIEARSRRSSVISKRSSVHPEEEDDEVGAEVPNEWLNNFTIRSIATFMRADGDVYAGGFGRVHLRKGDLMQTTPNDTLRSRSSAHR